MKNYTAHTSHWTNIKLLFSDINSLYYNTIMYRGLQKQPLLW